MKLKPKTAKCLKMFFILWGIVILYEFIFMNTKFGLNNYIKEDSLLYILMILAPMLAVTAFLGAFVVASHYKEISDTWEKNPEKIIDELKLLGIGLLFFVIIFFLYLCLYKFGILK